VLYFDNLSRDTSDAYLADGLTDEIILRLQQVRRLEVKSRFESQRVRGRQRAAPAALGRELAARYLVDGTIQREGDRLVVRVELTRADRGVGVWSERFDKSRASVLDLIDDVARAVATGVAGELLPAETADLARRPTADAAAYEHFVRGNVYLAQRTPEGLARAADEYEAAYMRDAGLKIAVGRVAYVYALGITYGLGDLPADTVLERGGRAVERAMQTAPGVADTWMALGFRQFMRSRLGLGDFIQEAVAALGRATQLDPGSAEAHHQYGQGLIVAGRDSAALAEYRRALALEPGRAVSYEEVAWVFLLERRYADAVAWCDSALAADPQFVRGYLIRGRSQILLGDYAAAERDVARATALARGGDAGSARTLHAFLLAARGDTAGARSLGPGGSVGNFSPEVSAAVGEPDRALDQLESYRSPALRCYAIRLPANAALRGRPRFDRLAAACPAPVSAP
jgi:TolB-like protein/Flp pilus assembly protein TadD